VSHLVAASFKSTRRLSLMVRCRYEDKGCSDVVKYENLERHEQACSFNCVECAKGCGLVIRQSELKTHDCVKELKLQVQDLKLKNMELEEKLQEKSKDCPQCGFQVNAGTTPVIINKPIAKSGFKKFMSPFSKVSPAHLMIFLSICLCFKALAAANHWIHDEPFV
jgi:hypothetical protein